MTAVKVERRLGEINLGQLNAADREKSLRSLMDEINALSPEERKIYRQDGKWKLLFNELNEEEKSAFIEGTMPGGFKQALAAFEQLPPEKRKRTIDEALKQLRENANPQNLTGTNELVIDADLQKKMVNVGLKTYYSESSAQTKAELAPMLEEMQKMMEQGKLFRRDY